MDKITNPHDKLFRDTWSNKEAARDFLRQYLPADVLQTIDLDSLSISKDSFIDRDLWASQYPIGLHPEFSLRTDRFNKFFR